MSDTRLTAAERRASLSLAAIFALRMFGLFMIYPVFALYAQSLPDATPARVGFALGVYGLSQALLQMPLGMLSDRVERKTVIAGGLLMFALGSAVAAMAHSVAGIAVGRLLQGVGAVGSTVLALAADLTREAQRTKAMALIGVSIGGAFALALVLGPLLNDWIGVPGMFWFTALLAGVALLVLYTLVPSSGAHTVHAETEAVPALLGRVLKDPQLLRLDFGILAQHAVLTASFLSLPMLLSTAGLKTDAEWQIYLPALIISVLALAPMVLRAERGGQMRLMLLLSVAVLGLAQLAFLLAGHDLWFLAAGLTVFFTAFNFLEAALPSLISRLAPAGARGTAMGVYSSAQFLGIFLGGAVGGWCQGHLGPAGGCMFGLGATLLWLWSTWSLPTSAMAGPLRGQ